MMLCTGSMDRVCGCLTRPQTVPQKPLAPSLTQKSNSMIKTVIPGRANWNMSFLIAFRTIPCLLRNPFSAIVSNSASFDRSKHQRLHHGQQFDVAIVFVLPISVTAYEAARKATTAKVNDSQSKANGHDLTLSRPHSDIDGCQP